MAIVIDISQWTRPQPPNVVAPSDAPPDARVTVERERWDACKHRSMAIDATQRTVKCGECGMWLDPVWCLQELFNYYEKRVDSRMEAIKEFERKQAEAEKRRRDRKQQPREHLIRRRQESLERAAYNEYQAKLLTIRAGRQRASADKIDRALAALSSAAAEDRHAD